MEDVAVAFVPVAGVVVVEVPVVALAAGVPAANAIPPTAVARTIAVTRVVTLHIDFSLGRPGEKAGTRAGGVGPVVHHPMAAP